MHRLAPRRISPPLLASTTAALASWSGLGPVQDPASAGGPAQGKLEKFLQDVAQKFPAERLKAYDEGVDQVEKSVLLAQALKVRNKVPDFDLPDGAGKVDKLADKL